MVRKASLGVLGTSTPLRAQHWFPDEMFLSLRSCEDPVLLAEGAAALAVYSGEIDVDRLKCFVEHVCAVCTRENVCVRDKRCWSSLRGQNSQNSQNGQNDWPWELRVELLEKQDPKEVLQHEALQGEVQWEEEKQVQRGVRRGVRRRGRERCVWNVWIPWLPFTAIGCDPGFPFPLPHVWNKDVKSCSTLCTGPFPPLFPALPRQKKRSKGGKQR